MMLFLESGLKIILIVRLKIRLSTLSSELVGKNLSRLLKTRLTPRKVGMIPPSRIVSLGVGIEIWSSKGWLYY